MAHSFRAADPRPGIDARAPDTFAPSGVHRRYLGSIYHDGDHCMPHSHLRSDVSVVYMLDTGDEDPDDKLSARLCFADPRIDACCPDEPGRVTRHVIPVMTPGTMLIFSSDYLHSVNPYRGQRPRITLSWNITLERLPGRPGEGWM